MSTLPDDRDQHERDTLSGLEDQLQAIRLRHVDDPPCDLLAAARADLLPAETQARVVSHLDQSAWSRALAEGLSQSQDEADLDAVSEERLLGRIKSELRKEPHSHGSRGRTGFAIGGLALAATVLIGVIVNRGPLNPEPVPEATPQAVPGSTAAPTPQAPPLRLAFTKPDVKLSTGALTWRGAAGDNPFLTDLGPAFDAYRQGDYARAESVFDRLSGKYTASIEVMFYLGVTRMLRDDFAGALAPLVKADGLGNAMFADDVSWFLAVAEQRSGKVRESQSRLSALCGGTGSRAADACGAVATLGALAPPAPAKEP